MSNLRIGVVHSIVRPEEKQIMAALDAHNEVEWQALDDRKLGFDPRRMHYGFDAVLARSVSSSRNIYTRRMFESAGVRCINPVSVAEVCNDKLATSLALLSARVPHPELRIAFSEEVALEVMEEIGYPIVVKPVVGSWGRLIARANDADTARSLLEHKKALPSFQHHVYYVQEYIEKNGRDIRTFVVGDECIAAILRESSDWRTNTARGATVKPLTVTPDLKAISLAAARAVGGGVLAIDLFESSDGYLVNEVNDTMEFRNSVEPTGVDIPAAIVEYVVDVAREARAA